MKKNGGGLDIVMVWMIIPELYIYKII